MHPDKILLKNSYRSTASTGALVRAFGYRGGIPVQKQATIPGKAA